VSIGLTERRSTISNSVPSVASSLATANDSCNIALYVTIVASLPTLAILALPIGKSFLISFRLLDGNKDIYVHKRLSGLQFLLPLTTSSRRRQRLPALKQLTLDNAHKRLQGSDYEMDRRQVFPLMAA
jgi:hypothetical protein